MKQTRLFMQSILILMLATMAMAPLLAQDDDETEDEIVFAVCGEVEFTDDEIVVDGINIAPAGSFNPSELEEGDVVGLTGTLLNDDTLKATSLTELEDLAECPTDDEEEDNGDDTGDDNEEEDDDTGDDDDDTCEVADEGDDDTGDDEAGDDEADECEEEDDDGKQHPIARILSEEFDLDYDEIMEWHEEGLGFGEISRALLLADQVEDVDVEDIFAALADGEGWGQILRDYDISPSALAPGRVISGRYNPEAASSQNNGNNRGNGNGNGNNGNGRGNGNANGNGNGGANGRGNGNANGNGNGRG